MKIYLRKFFSVSIILFSIVNSPVFSHESNTWYTEFDFWWWSKNLSIYASGGETRPVSFYLRNLWDTTISWKFSVVDASEILDWFLACKSEWQNEILWKYSSIEQTWFYITPWSTFTGNVSFYFPEDYSWEYNMCVLYSPSWEEQVDYINTEPRKALFVKAILNATATTYQLKAFPGSRSKSSLANKWEIRFYDTSNNLVYSNDDIISDSGWLATFAALVPRGTYTIVYKWQSHLASYLYDILVIPGETLIFDFTTWLDLTWVQNYTNVSDNGYKYQIAWDLKSIDWKYDFIVNWNDISIITTSWFVDHVEDLDPRDLNWDNVINVSDLSIIWANFRQKDVFYDDNMYHWLW